MLYLCVINAQMHFRIMKRIKQINNILIKENLSDSKYYCITPDKRILEQFDTLVAAKNWCEQTLYFTRKAEFDIEGIITDRVIERMAESHFECWKERYSKYKTIKNAKIDLYVYHDPSLEIEKCEELLNRELTYIEYELVVNNFNKNVIKLYRESK